MVSGDVSALGSRCTCADNDDAVAPTRRMARLSHRMGQFPAAARSSAAMSIFFILSIAFIVRPARATRYSPFAMRNRM